MELPNLENLMAQLERWRVEVLKDRPKNDLHLEFIEECRTLEIKPLCLKTFRERLQIQPADQRLRYMELIAILRTYKVPCVDLFFDDTQEISIRDVRVVSAGERSQKKEKVVPHLDPATIEHLIPEFLGRGRIRIDLVIVPKGQSTEWKPHSGSEIGFVTKGEPVFEISESEDGDVKPFPLKEGDIISFPSRLFHKISSPLCDSEIVVARPTFAYPRATDS